MKTRAYQFVWTGGEALLSNDPEMVAVHFGFPLKRPYKGTEPKTHTHTAKTGLLLETCSKHQNDGVNGG